MAVVSYSLIDYPVADFPRITHFGYCDGEPGRHIGAHYHLGLEVVYIKRGGARIGVFPYDDPIDCMDDDVLLVAPGVLHRFDIPTSNIVYYWIGIQMQPSVGITSDHRIPPKALLSRKAVSGRFLTPDHDYPELIKLGSVLDVQRFTMIHNAPELFAPFESLREEISTSRHLQLFAIYAKLLELLVAVHRRLLPEARTTPRSDLIRAVTDHVRAHLEEDLSVDRLSRFVGLSPSHLSRRFHAETGFTLSEYVTNRRLEHAKELLLAGLRVGDVAERCGFSSIYSFSTVFKRRVGCTPRSYRGSTSPR